MHETSLDDFWPTVDCNLTSTFLALAAFLPGMVEQGGGAVVTMSSLVARRPATGAPVAFLASDASSWITGLVIDVAGGR